MKKNKRIVECPACGRTMVEPVRFCNPNCEKYQHMFKKGVLGDKEEVFYKDFRVQDWVVGVGRPDMPIGSKYLG